MAQRHKPRYSMFESLKHWLESISEEGKLFHDTDDEVLHSALASLLYHFITLDKRHGGKEKHEFDRLMKQELGLGQEQIDHLYQSAKSASSDPHDDLQIVNAHLKEYPASRLLFMQKLLQLIDAHGVHSSELRLFYETLHQVFPEVKDTRERDGV